ncbi:hypothetical protein [Catellicoccus marimammalium]|uniref:hypothetical protein n=1 Tax=Catellicoccus marimammalium TaxID=300419 RepID=UPI0039F11442
MQKLHSNAPVNKAPTKCYHLSFLASTIFYGILAKIISFFFSLVEEKIKIKGILDKKAIFYL